MKEQIEMDPEYLNDELLFPGIQYIDENEHCAGNLRGVGLLSRDRIMLENDEDCKAHDPESGAHFEVDDFCYRLKALKERRKIIDRDVEKWMSRNKQKEVDRKI